MYEFMKLTENVYVFVQPALIWYSAAERCKSVK